MQCPRVTTFVAQCQNLEITDQALKMVLLAICAGPMFKPETLRQCLDAIKKSGRTELLKDIAGIFFDGNLVVHEFVVIEQIRGLETTEAPRRTED